VPIAPIGTKVRILVTDVTTGETIEQSWVWHYLSNLARARTPGTGIAQDRTISESLAWMNRAANEVGLL